MKDLSGTKNISNLLIEQFDFWLASRREAIKNYVSPYSFSQYSNIDVTLSLDLFYVCTTEEINILKTRFDVFLKHTNTKVGSFYDYDKIPEKFEDLENGLEIEITENDIQIYFELIAEPTEIPKVEFGEDTGKPQGVGLKDYKDSSRRNGFSAGSILRKSKE